MAGRQVLDANILRGVVFQIPQMLLIEIGVAIVDIQAVHLQNFLYKTSTDRIPVQKGSLHAFRQFTGHRGFSGPGHSYKEH
ncbi:hypothetical protein D3C76_1515760 [compost metagenome]